MKYSRLVPVALVIGALGILSESHAALITNSLGNTAPGFNDGDTPTILELVAAQGGQPAPFDQGYGNDVLGTVFDEGWMHSYAAIVDPILSASLTIGIADHDSVATGSQVAAFTIDGIDFQATLDALFEGSGGGDNEYNVYQVLITGTALAGLADGNAPAALMLAAPGLQTPLLPPGPPVDSLGNGAHLVFSTLQIETQDATPAPAPGTMLLLTSGIIGLSFTRRRRRMAL